MKIMKSLLDTMQRKPLAFSSDSNFVAASSRIPLVTKDGTILNIEVFDDNTNDKSSILLLTHGVCASAETLGIQAIVSAAKQHKVKVAVLELEGHGLSSGQRMVCGDFDRLLNHVLEFVKHSVSVLRRPSDETPFFIAGNSLGGVLAIYAAQQISKNQGAYPSNFKGLASICPAVGVDPKKVPSMPIVQCLSFLSHVAPSLQVPLTPLEDPAGYNCPRDTERNFSGNWPLSTSKMLLDVTSKKVDNDIKSGNLSLQSLQNVLMFAGETDDVVPFKSIQNLHDSITPRNKRLVTVPDAGHDMMFFEKHAKVVTDSLFNWILSQ